jgi:hypothetical protein
MVPATVTVAIRVLPTSPLIGSPPVPLRPIAGFVGSSSSTTPGAQATSTIFTLPVVLNRTAH